MGIRASPASKEKVSGVHAAVHTVALPPLFTCISGAGRQRVAITAMLGPVVWFITTIYVLYETKELACPSDRARACQQLKVLQSRLEAPSTQGALFHSNAWTRGQPARCERLARNARGYRNRSARPERSSGNVQVVSR